MLGIFLVLIAIMGTFGGIDGFEAGGERIALIRVDGMIVAGESGFSMFGGAATGSDDIVDQIDSAIDDGNVKGILLRVNSPGGSAAGSQEIYSAVQRARKAGKIVVASMADVAASGGYYVAAPCDSIFADPATLTGSIGAIAIHEDLSGLFGKIGIDTEIIKSGELKDMFQPAGPLSPEARDVITTLINEVFNQFVNHVAEGRGMDREAVLALADGRVYTGQQAKENGLIDEIGGFHEALIQAGKLAGISGKPQLKKYGPPSVLQWLLGEVSSVRQREVTVTGGLLYDDFAARLAQGNLHPAPPAAQPTRPGDM
ncbi:MAG TPA: signal peptide peptidase SppA [Armatimonadota bacterium]|nr:signal peptide peptidase SppA [Armatimonadota bacterium]